MIVKLLNVAFLIVFISCTATRHKSKNKSHNKNKAKLFSSTSTVKL